VCTNEHGSDAATGDCDGAVVLNDLRLTALLTQAGLPSAHTVTPLLGGGNNRLFVVETDAGRVVLKMYFQHPDDPRDRLSAEFGFSQFAWAHGVRSIPRPRAADMTECLGMYDYVVGARPDVVDAAAVDQSLAFLAQLNGQRERGHALPNASEACFSLEAHLDRVAARVAGLESLQDDESRRLVVDLLMPGWLAIRLAVAIAARRDGTSLSQPLAVADRCISPSDFGFHNTLLDAQGKYWFLDFEYAGWDDPAKLVCDFFCQPERPVPMRFFDAVVTAIARRTADPAWHARRIQLLWPVYQLKWACIVLNEQAVLPSTRQRRHIARPAGSHSDQRLERARTLATQAIEATPG
jgi:phosphotransferase family enzyme